MGDNEIIHHRQVLYTKVLLYFGKLVSFFSAPQFAVLLILLLVFYSVQFVLPSFSKKRGDMKAFNTDLKRILHYIFSTFIGVSLHKH